MRAMMVVLLMTLGASLGQAEDDPGDEPLPRGALQRFGCARLSHAGDVQWASYSPDGKLLASYAYGGWLQIWRGGSWQRVHRHKMESGYVHFRWFADSERLLVLDRQQLTVLHVPTRKTRKVARLPADPEALALSPAGVLVAVADESEKVQIVNLKTGKTITSIALDRDADQVVFTPTSDRLLVFVSGTLRTYEVGSWKLKGQVKLPAEPEQLAFSPDGQRLLLVADGVLQLMTLDKPEAVRDLSSEDVRRCAWLPDGEILSIGSEKHGLRRWTIDGQIRWQIDQVASRALCARPDGARLAVGRGHHLQVRSAATGELLSRHSPHHGNVYAAALSADGGQLLTGSSDDTASLWDATSGKHLHRMKGHTNDVWAVLFAPGGKELLTGSRDESIRYWDRKSGKLLHTTKDAAKDYVFALACHGEGTAASGGGEGNSVRLWDLRERRPVAAFRDQQARTGKAYGLVYSSCGRYLAAAHNSGVRILDARSGAQLTRLAVQGGEEVYGVAFSPDGTLLASAGVGKKVRIWEVTTGELISELSGHDGDIYSLEFSPCGRMIASAAHGELSTVRIWDVRNFTQRLALEGHLGSVYRARFGPKPGTLYTAGADTTVVLWDLAAAGLKLPALPAPAPKQWPALLNQVRGKDAKAAHRAGWRLVAAGGPAATWLTARIQPSDGLDPDRLEDLLAKLGSRRFREREQATAALAALGGRALPFLREALGRDISAEAKARAKALIATLGRDALKASGAGLGARRMLALLERIPGPEARAGLQRLARGAAGAELTVEAKAALARHAR